MTCYDMSNPTAHYHESYETVKIVLKTKTPHHTNKEHLVEEREEGVEVVLSDDAASLHARQEVKEKARLVQTHHLSIRTL